MYAQAKWINENSFFSLNANLIKQHTSAIKITFPLKARKSYHSIRNEDKSCQTKLGLQMILRFQWEE